MWLYKLASVVTHPLTHKRTFFPLSINTSIVVSVALKRKYVREALGVCPISPLRTQTFNRLWLAGGNTAGSVSSRTRGSRSGRPSESDYWHTGLVVKARCPDPLILVLVVTDGSSLNFSSLKAACYTIFSRLWLAVLKPKG